MWEVPEKGYADADRSAVGVVVSLFTASAQGPERT
ncbi:hypothetical protein Cf24236_0302 [Citrobacter farmeri]|nr:hypothetical protein Cf24236_0302 [Citrobacter farmeri]